MAEPIKKDKAGRLVVDAKGRGELRVRMDPADLENLQRIADERVVGIELLVRKALEAYLPTLEDKEVE